MGQVLVRVGVTVHVPLQPGSGSLGDGKALLQTLGRIHWLPPAWQLYLDEVHSDVPCDLFREV